MLSSGAGPPMGTYAHALQHVLGLLVDIELAALRLSEVEGRNLRHILILPLTLLLLQLEGNTTDGATLDTAHQVGGEAGNLVAETLGGDDGDLIEDPLVDLEIEGELGVVSLNDDLGRLLDGLNCRTVSEQRSEDVVGR
jgi:hypothetical protein